MKRLLLLFSVFAAMTVAHAQQKNLETVLAEHPEFLAGSDYLCPADAIKLTPAPKGYKPLFISHYGRHGARYAWQDDMYERIREVFEKADGDANLQFVFYTGKKKDVLVKVLLNGQEATLPMATDNWPYYKWSDFKAQYGSL